MDDNYKAALLRWRSVTINMQRTVHIGDASIELDPTGYAYKSKGNMTDDDYHNLFVLQQQYHSFTGRAKRDRAQTMQVENRDTGKKKRIARKRAIHEDSQKKELLHEQGQDQCKRITVEHEHARRASSHTQAHASRDYHHIHTFI